MLWTVYLEISWGYMFESIDVKIGEIAFCDNGDYLKEDLFQIKYPNEIMVDVGWYQGVNGFIIFVIQSYDWENPVMKHVIHDEKEMLLNLQKIIDEICEK